MTATAFAAETSQLPAHFLVLVDGDSDGTEFSFWGNANKASRYYARRGHAVEIRPVFARREDEYAYYARPAWDEAALFTELDGMTFADREELSHPPGGGPPAAPSVIQTGAHPWAATPPGAPAYPACISTAWC
jgi:hypothetical protein